MLMVDLFCGRGGWTKGFMQHGWQCRGYDWKPQPAYPAEFVQADILSLTLADIADADFICCSSPCEQFSVHCMEHFHKNPPFPAKGIELFKRGRFLCDEKPHIMENVRCAERFVGRAVNHCGPFYLWGNAVPAIMPLDVLRGLRKGFERKDSHAYRKANYGAVRQERLKAGIRRHWGPRVSDASGAAEIPLVLSAYLAKISSAQVAP